MTHLIIGVSVVFVLVSIVVIIAIHNERTTGIEISLTRSSGLSIKIRKQANKIQKK